MRRTLNYIFIAIAFLLLCGCADEWAGVTRESQNYSFTAFIKSINTFPYEASTTRQEKAINGYKAISLRMGKKEVERILGQPDAEFMSYNLNRGKEAFVNSSWAYYLHRHERELANETFDRVIFLYFDINEKLYRALPTNIATLLELGTPLNMEPANQ